MQSQATAEERRTSLRRGTYAVIRIKDTGGGSSWRFVEDVSLGGLRICNPDALAEGDEVEMELFTSTTGEVFRCRGRVVWCEPGTTGRAGLTFVEMEPAMRHWLAQHLEGR